MPVSEFRSWVAFYKLHPFDDLHRYFRPAALISVSSGGGDIQDKLDWLQPQLGMEGYSAADIRTMRALGVSKG